MRRSRSPASSCCIASARDSSDWDVWAFKAELRLQSGTRCLGLDVCAAQQGAFARAGQFAPEPLNNLIEQDHRGVKQRIAVMLGFKGFRNATIVIAGIELMHRIRK